MSDKKEIIITLTQDSTDVRFEKNGAPIMEARARCPCCGLGVPKDVCQKDIFEDM